MSKQSNKDLASKCTAIVKRQADNTLQWQCPFNFCGTSHQGERALELHLKRDHGAVNIVPLSNVWNLIGLLELLRNLQISQDPSEATPDKRNLLLCPVCRSIGVTGSEYTFSQHLQGRQECAEWSRETIPAMEEFLLPKDDTGSSDCDDDDEQNANQAGSSTQAVAGGGAANTDVADEQWDSDSEFEMEVEARCLYCDEVTMTAFKHMKESHDCDLRSMLATYRKQLKSQGAKTKTAAPGEAEEQTPAAQDVVQADVQTSRLEHFNIRFVNYVRKQMNSVQCPTGTTAGIPKFDGKGLSDLQKHVIQHKLFGPATIEDFPAGFHEDEELLVPFLPKDGLIQLVLMMDADDEEEEEEPDYPMVPSMAELAARRQQ